MPRIENTEHEPTHKDVDPEKERRIQAAHDAMIGHTRKANPEPEEGLIVDPNFAPEMEPMTEDRLDEFWP